MNERPGEDPFPTPGLAVGLALGAGLARAVLILMMVPALGSRPALVGIATIVAFGATFALAAQEIERIKPVLDLRPLVQVATSWETDTALHGDREETGIRQVYLNWLDWDEIYLEMLRWRREREFINMAIGRLRSDDIYNQIASYPLPEHR